MELYSEVIDDSFWSSLFQKFSSGAGNYQGFSQIWFLYLFRRAHFPEQLTIPFFRKETTRRPPEENLRLAFEELGTTFIKLGQILSTRLDLLPEEYCQELRKLQEQTSPVSFLEIKEVVEGN